MGPQNLSDPTAAASKVPVLHITKDDHVEELFLIVYRVSLQLVLYLFALQAKILIILTCC